MITSLQRRVIEEMETYIKTCGNPVWNISRETGEYIHALIVEHGCRLGVECGSGIGYSSLWIASALRQNKGRLITFEFYPPKAILAANFLRKARLGSVAEVICSSATKGLRHIPRGVDFVFLDARKGDYVAHFKLLEKKMKRGCLVIADNVRSHASELSEYLAYVRSRHESEYRDIGTGLEITRFASTMRKSKIPA